MIPKKMLSGHGIETMDVLTLLEASEKGCPACVHFNSLESPLHVYSSAGLNYVGSCAVVMGFVKEGSFCGSWTARDELHR